MYYKTKRPAMWDELALEYLGSEFEASRLLRMQEVKDFDSVVYSFIVPSGSTIRVDDAAETASNTYPAPWEA